MNDKELLDWAEEHVDDVQILRDLSAGTRVILNFCYEKTGCPGEVTGRNLREAIALAAEEDK